MFLFLQYESSQLPQYKKQCQSHCKIILLKQKQTEVWSKCSLKTISYTLAGVAANKRHRTRIIAETSCHKIAGYMIQ